MAYFIQSLICLQEILLGDLDADVPHGGRLKESPRHVVYHDDLGSQLLIGSNRGRFMDEEPERLQRWSRCEQSVHLAIVELLADEPAAIDRVLVVPFVDVDPSGPDYLPLVLQGLMPWDFVVHSFVPDVGNLLTSGFNDLPNIELHAREIIICQG